MIPCSVVVLTFQIHFIQLQIHKHDTCQKFSTNAFRYDSYLMLQKHLQHHISVTTDSGICKKNITVLAVSRWGSAHFFACADFSDACSCLVHRV